MAFTAPKDCSRMILARGPSEGLVHPDLSTTMEIELAVAHSTPVCFFCMHESTISFSTEVWRRQVFLPPLTLINCSLPCV